MKYIQGQNREQISLFPISLEATIDKENPVRVIDFFVDSLNLKDTGYHADVGFMFIAYLLKRIMNIIGIEKLIKYLGKLINSLFTYFLAKKAILNHKNQF